MKKILFSFWCTCFMSSVLLAQQAVDTAFHSASVQHAKNIFSMARGNQSHLYNGEAYYEPKQTSTNEFPYFQTSDWTTGTIHYDGGDYKDIPVLYDLTNDNVITELPQNGLKIKLVSGKITFFTMENRKFVNLHDLKIKPGFYGVLYSGPSKVYARYEKSRQEQISQGVVMISFEKRTRYYIFKNGNYFQVRSKGDVLKVFGDKKRELKQAAQKNNLQFKKNREQSIVKLAELYDTI
jgi:hypothetical protein